jgi:hypothetical protein
MIWVPFGWRVLNHQLGLSQGLSCRRSDSTLMMVYTAIRLNQFASDVD